MPLPPASYLAVVLLPPFCLLLLGLGGFVLLKRRPRTAKFLIGAMLALLWTMSMPLVGDSLLAYLDEESDLAQMHAAGLRRARAIVVLSAGYYRDAVEFQGDTVDALSLERVRRAAILHRQTGLPLLATGGRPGYDGQSLAALMKIAASEFAVPVKWLEEQARTTDENAQFSRRILAPEGIDTILLVTHGWHMPRARRAFERAGFKVVPAATGLTHHPQVAISSLLPSAEGLRNTGYFMHEAIGLLWYQVIEGGAAK